MDEAGISRPEEEPHLVVAAVIVDADDKLVAVERHLDKLVKKHIPEHLQDGFVFHAHELFNGRGKVFDPKKNTGAWCSPENRLRTADALAAIPKKFDLPIAFGWVEKSQFPSEPEARKSFKLEKPAKQIIFTHAAAFMSCALMVEHWMRKMAPQEVCLMVVEDNEQARSFLRETQNYHQNPKLAETLDEETRRFFPLRKIKEDPLFQRKRSSSVLQIADFCAYVWKKYLLKDAGYDPRFIDPIWGQLVAPVVPIPKERLS